MLMAGNYVKRLGMSGLRSFFDTCQIIGHSCEKRKQEVQAQPVTVWKGKTDGRDTNRVVGNDKVIKETGK